MIVKGKHTKCPFRRGRLDIFVLLRAVKITVVNEHGLAAVDYDGADTVAGIEKMGFQFGSGKGRDKEQE